MTNRAEQHPRLSATDSLCRLPQRRALQPIFTKHHVREFGRHMAPIGRGAKGGMPGAGEWVFAQGGQRFSAMSNA